MTKRSHTLRFLARLGPFGLGALLACAPPPSQVKVEELNRQIAALKAQNTGYTRRIEELENQVFVLSDRGDGEPVGQRHLTAPNLPRVTLTPGRSLADAAGDGGVAITNFGEDDTVEYAGEAAKPSKSRPVLRLVGNGSGVAAEESAVDAPRRIAVAPPPRKASLATGPAANFETRKVALHAPDATAMAFYKQALDHLKGGRHADAAAGFREFLRRFGQHEYADNAQYWLAECYYDLKDFVTAVSEFRKVVEGYPGGNKVPDALLKVGLAYLSLGNEAAGRSTMAELVRSYPTHSAARLAAEKLNEVDGKHAEAALAGSSDR